MLLLAIISTALAGNPIKDLTKAYDCLQPVESSWTEAYGFSDGSSVWHTDRVSRVQGIEGDPFVLLDPQGLVRQAAFVYDFGFIPAKKTDKAFEQIFKAIEKSKAELLTITDREMIWKVDKGLLVAESINQYELMITLMCQE